MPSLCLQTGLARDLLTHAERADQASRAGAGPGRTSGSLAVSSLVRGARCTGTLLPSASIPHAAGKCLVKPTDANFSPPGIELMLRYELWLAPFESKRSGPTWARSKAQGRRSVIRAVPDFGSTRLALKRFGILASFCQ
jgi:hypothetical protein